MYKNSKNSPTKLIYKLTKRKLTIRISEKAKKQQITLTFFGIINSPTYVCRS